MILFVKVQCIGFPSLIEKLPVIWTKNGKVIVGNVGYNKYDIYKRLFYVLNLFEIYLNDRCLSLLRLFLNKNKYTSVNINYGALYCLGHYGKFFTSFLKIIFY